MSYSRIFRFAGVLALVLNFWTAAGHADDGHGLRYRYVALDQVALPTGFTSFSPSSIRDNGGSMARFAIARAALLSWPTSRRAA
jgi:hypothetical protein